MSNPKGEFELIEWIRRQFGPAAVPIGIGDDMASVAVSDPGGVLITTDMLLDGVHFMTAQHSLEQIGRKAVACSLSDTAAMAAVPVAAVLSIALSRQMSLAQAQSLLRGAEKIARQFSCPLVGGDTTSWPRPLAINVALLADPKGIAPVRRDGAQLGDAVCVTGALGGSRSGKHLSFQPRVHEARALAKAYQIHAMIDISDGLAADLNHICQASSRGAILDAEKVPIDPSAQSLDAALHDGEDFELLFTLGQADAERLASEWRDATPISRIGTIVESAGLQLRTEQGRLQPLEPRGYEHAFGT